MYTIQPEPPTITHPREENTALMTAPIPTPHDLTEMLRENRVIIGHLFYQSRWENMTDEQRSSVLRILTLTAETTLKLSEIAHADALGRNGLANGGAKGEIDLARAEMEKMKAETAKVAAETGKVRMEAEKLKADTAKATAEEERWTVEVLRLRAESAYKEYLANSRTT